MKSARTATTLLLVVTLTATGCSYVFSPPDNSPVPSSAVRQLAIPPLIAKKPSGEYGQYSIGLVDSPQGIEGGNGCYDDTGKFVVLIDNKNAKDPTYAEMTAFLQQDKTDQFPYQLQLNPNAVYFDRPENLVDIKRVQNIIDGTAQPSPPLICADFAERLHNNAEIAGIRCGYVTIDFTGKSIGHAVAVFNTTDAGLIYIDDTGVDKLQSDMIIGQNGTTSSASSNDKVAYIAVGKPYGLITLENAPNFGTNYTGYTGWLTAQSSLETMEAQFADLQTQIVPTRTQIDDLTTEYALLKAQYDQITGGQTKLPPNIYNQAIPVMTKMNDINNERNVLIETLNTVIAEINTISDQYNATVKKMGPTWESLGTVSNFFITWEGEWGTN